ncbi:MAG: hypothetical protein SH847_24440 [Roseiflexaceae bacterium]|nr:hypothetical protein [Roseiflexaceae bacterium]
MYTLTNGTLTVSVLDPVADQHRFGPRYCTGGYIFQITDIQHGKLLTGPTYPESFNWFDGQGIPDGFNLSPLREQPDSEIALIIGIGLCDLQAKRVIEFCQWNVEQSSAHLHFRTAHTFHGYGCTLERTVTLHQRTVRSTTHINNTGSRPIPIRWFPHPFFPHPETDELCRFNIPVRFPDTPHYEMATSGFIARSGWPWAEGYFQALDHSANAPLMVLQKHPLLGLVAATCSYVPGFFPIWGNQYTFSWEPFFEQTIDIGQETSWSIDYDF